VPGNQVADTFAGRPVEQRAIYDEIMTYLTTLGPVHADAVRVGVFLKSNRKLAELRPKSRWLSVSLYLPRAIVDPRIVRHISVSSERTVNQLKMFTVDDIDDTVRSWLAEAYLAATE
jgi:hypothetical protein